MKLFKFTETYTDIFYFDVEAETEEEAFEKMGDLGPEDATAKKNFGIETKLEEVIEIPPDDEPEEMTREEYDRAEKESHLHP